MNLGTRAIGQTPVIILICFLLFPLTPQPQGPGTEAQYTTIPDVTGKSKVSCAWPCCMLVHDLLYILYGTLVSVVTGEYYFPYTDRKL